MATEYPLIPRDTLLEQDRVVRPPLRRWAREIIDWLAEAERDGSPASWGSVARCMNNTSLIEVYLGSRERARASCMRQLRWVAKLARQHGLAAAGELAAQPWINLGRLACIERDRAEAFRHFALLLDTRAGRDLSLGPVVIDGATWQEIVRARSMTTFLETVYVADLVKTYMGARDFDGLLGFVAEARPIVTSATLAPMLDEAELLALAWLGRHGEALAVIGRPSWRRDPYCKLVCATYQATVLAADGQLDQVRPFVARIVDRVLDTNFDALTDPRVVRYLGHLGRLVRHVGRPDLAEKVLRKGLGVAQRLDDVPLVLTLIESLLALEELEAREAREAREGLVAARESLLHECGYATLLAARGVDLDVTADPVFDRLRETLERVARDPASNERSGGERHDRPVL